MPFNKMFLKHLRILPQRSKTFAEETANASCLSRKGIITAKIGFITTFLKINIIMKNLS